MTRSFSLSLLVLLLALPLSGCESFAAAMVDAMEANETATNGGSATAPRTSRTTQLAVTFHGMEVIRDCETIVEGAGDFDIRVDAQSSFASSASGEVYKGGPQISEGHRTGGFGRRVFEGPAVDGQTVRITFRASEIDTAPIRGDFSDPRLNNVTKTATHTFNNGTWSALGPRAITLGGGACEVRLHYELDQVS